MHALCLDAISLHMRLYVVRIEPFPGENTTSGNLPLLTAPFSTTAKFSFGAKFK